MSRPSAEAFKLFWDQSAWNPETHLQHNKNASGIEITSSGLHATHFSFSSFSSANDAGEALLALDLSESLRIHALLDSNEAVRWLTSNINFTQFHNKRSSLIQRRKKLEALSASESEAILRKHYISVAQSYFEKPDPTGWDTRPSFSYGLRPVFSSIYTELRAASFALYRSLLTECVPPSAADVIREAQEALSHLASYEANLLRLSSIDERLKAGLPMSVSVRHRARLETLIKVATEKPWNAGAGALGRYFLQEFCSALTEAGDHNQVPPMAASDLVLLIDPNAYISEDTAGRHIAKGHRTNLEEELRSQARERYRASMP